MELVIKELLHFAETKGLKELTKKVVNLSAQLNRLPNNQDSKIKNKEYNEINEALIDLVYGLDSRNVSAI